VTVGVTLFVGVGVEVTLFVGVGVIEQSPTKFTDAPSQSTNVGIPKEQILSDSPCSTVIILVFPSLQST